MSVLTRDCAASAGLALAGAGLHPVSANRQPHANAASRAVPPHARRDLAGASFDFNFPGNDNGQAAEAGAGAPGVTAYRGQAVRAKEGTRPTLWVAAALSGLFRAVAKTSNIWLKQIEQN